MWSNAWMVVCLVIVTTEGHPYNDRKLHQNEVQADVPFVRETKVPNDAKKINSSLNDSTILNKSHEEQSEPIVVVIPHDNNESTPIKLGASKCLNYSPTVVIPFEESNTNYINSAYVNTCQPGTSNSPLATPLDEIDEESDFNSDSEDGLNSDKRHSATSSKKVLPAPVVDDDLLEFLVRVADNPAEWNKIRRVLSMLGRDETETTSAAGNDGEATAAVTRPAKALTTTDEPAAGVPGTSSAAIPDDGADCVHHLHQPRNRELQTPKQRGSLRAPPSTPVPNADPMGLMRKSWPSSDWIRKTVDNMEAARPNSVYYEDDEERLYDDDDDDGGDELEMLDGAPEFLSLPPPSRRHGAVPPCRSPDDGCAEGDDGGGAYVAVVESAAATLSSDEHRRSVVARPKSPPPEPPRAVATADGGHMSRYQFKRIDGGGPDDGSGVNGTYVAVVENDDDPPH